MCISKASDWHSRTHRSTFWCNPMYCVKAVQKSARLAVKSISDMRFCMHVGLSAIRCNSFEFTNVIPVMYHHELYACYDATHAGHRCDRQRLRTCRRHSSSPKWCLCKITQLAWLLVRLMLCSGTLIDLSSAICECKRCYEHMRPGIAAK